MPKYVGKDMYISPVLGNQYSLGYSNELDGFVEHKIFPSKMVNARTGDIPSYDTGNIKSEGAPVRAVGAPAKSADFGVSIDKHWNLKRYAEQTPVFDEDVQDAKVSGSFFPDRDAIQFLAERMMINREILATGIATNASLITQNTTLGGGEYWDLPSVVPNDTVSIALDSIQERSMKIGNTIVVGHLLAKSIIYKNQDFKEQMKYVNTTFVGEMNTKKQMETMLSLYFGLNCVIASAQYDDAKEGVTSAKKPFIWGNFAFVCYVEPSPRPRSRTFGRNYFLDQDKKEKWRDADKSKYTTHYSLQWELEHKIIDSDCAYLIIDPSTP